MEKRNNKYHIDLKELELKDGSMAGKNLSFEFENHDDLFKIFYLIKNKISLKMKKRLLNLH
nr:DUF3861 domain-containing protein [Chryseobacterium foetidum]